MFMFCICYEQIWCICIFVYIHTMYFLDGIQIAFSCQLVWRGNQKRPRDWDHFAKQIMKVERVAIEKQTFIVKRPNEHHCGSTRFTLWSLKVELVTNGYTKQKKWKKHTVNVVKMQTNWKQREINAENHLNSNS